MIRKNSNWSGVFWRRQGLSQPTAEARPAALPAAPWVPAAPEIFGVRRGALRQWAWLYWLSLALALTVLAGGVGLMLGILLLGFRLQRLPAKHAALVYFPDLMPCLWLDCQRVVLGAPYRVVYRDELQPADFARLRRRARGLPG